jgi:hypothetical protein
MGLSPRPPTLAPSFNDKRETQMIKRVMAAAAAAVAVAAVMAACGGGGGDTTPFTVKLIGFNDYHGNLESPGTFGANLSVAAARPSAAPSSWPRMFRA